MMSGFLHDNLSSIAYGVAGLVILFTLILLVRTRYILTFIIAAGMSMLALALLITGYLCIPIFKSNHVVSVRSSANIDFDPEKSYRIKLELRTMLGDQRLYALYTAGALISIGLGGLIFRCVMNDHSVNCNTESDR
jgi:hypothetical protein